MKDEEVNKILEIETCALKRISFNRIKRLKDVITQCKSLATYHREEKENLYAKLRGHTKALSAVKYTRQWQRAKRKKRTVGTELGEERQTSY